MKYIPSNAEFSIEYWALLLSASKFICEQVSLCTVGEEDDVKDVFSASTICELSKFHTPFQRLIGLLRVH